MTLSHVRAWACLALVGLCGLASAEVPAATAEALMRKSGAWAQMSDVAPQVMAGITQSSTSRPLGRDALRHLEQLAQESFAPERLQVSFQQVLQERVSPAHATAALTWFDSPTGKLMTKLEESASAQSGDINRAMADGNLALAQASAKRQALLARVVKTTHAAEGMVTLQINTTIGVLLGVASVALDADGPSPEKLRSLLEAQRPQMLASSMGVVLTLFALTYHSASDKALEQYVRFLSSPAGASLSDAMMDALDQTLSSAAQRLGRGINAPAATSL